MRRITLLLSGTLLMAAIAPAGMAAAAEPQSVHIVASVSFRTAPSTSSTVMRYLKSGESLTLLEKTNSYWYKVQDASGQVGYVSSQAKYVNLIGGGSSTGAVDGSNAVIVSGVSFRKSPSTSGAFMRYLKKGEQVTVTSKINSYWYAVKDASGVSGYVSTNSKYIKLTGSVPAPSTPSAPAAPSAPSTGGDSVSAQVEAVIAAGMKYLGTPYEYGSSRSNTATFDCSDFVRQAFKDALGITLPADSRGQGEYVRSKSQVTTDWTKLKRGDLMFFMSYKGTSASNYTSKSPFGTRITHVGIYLGNGQILQTYSNESGGVRVDSIAGKHWEYRFLYGGSAL
ncbi:SH3 domain-containing C40 family peptidase [Cohnella algarum]|uniref:C40 family peptidase n=1 Tax=Cohnella algarum TaxID=2044859 RepID=UPI001F0810EB|nr:SH3 domain-containing C40 family peptidase [Cohnella algarum]